MDAAGIDKVALARRLGAESPRGQSPFAISRGDQFEKRVKRDEFLELFALLRPFGLDPITVEALELPDIIPLEGSAIDQSLTERAAATREALRSIADGTAPPGLVIDKATLVWRIGEVDVRLETDAIAWWVGGLLRVVEIKSYPIEWGQLAADKVSALSWQTAVYVAAVQDTLRDLGFDPALVSTEIFLVCPQNTGLRPTIVAHDVAPQLRLLRRYELREDSLVHIASAAGHVSLDTEHPADAFARLAPSYQPNCLSTCDLARYCRQRAQRVGEPRQLGSEVVQLTIGLGDLARAFAMGSSGIADRDDDAARHFVGLIEHLRQIEATMNGSAP